MNKITVKIDGMMCGMCESHINDTVRHAFPVKKVTSSHAKGETVILTETSIDETALRSVIDATGYKVLSVESVPYEKKGVLKNRGGNEVKNQDHLPHYGLGPVLVVFMIAVTVGGIVLSELGRFPKIGVGALKLPAAVLGGLLIIIGAAITAAALFVSKIHRFIDSGELLTTGVYAWVRNPIYSGIMFACTGTILIYGNLALIVFPLIMYFAVTAAVKKTEEEWLAKRFGKEYEDYRRRVNRCIPWVSRR